MSLELFIHATGICALVLNIVALVHTCERRLRMHSGIAGIVWALNNLLLGAHTAAALSLVSAGRTATSAVTLVATERQRHWACGAFAALTLGVGLLTWNGWASALIIVASLLSTYTMFYLRGRRLRASLLLVSAMWMVHAWNLDSWEQMLANVLTAIAALYSGWRLGRTGADAEPPAPASR
jgi:hypothetical protein